MSTNELSYWFPYYKIFYYCHPRFRTDVVQLFDMFHWACRRSDVSGFLTRISPTDIPLWSKRLTWTTLLD